MGRQSISFVIPAFNAAPFISDALSSVACQSRLPDEIVVVDDGSTDGTAGIVADWAQRHRVEVRIIQQANRGLPGARNSGIRAAKGELIALLDADDVISPDHLESLEKAYQLCSDVALCFGDARSVTNDGRIVREWLPGSQMEKLPYVERDGVRFVSGSAYAGVVYGSPIPNCCTLIRRAAAERIGLYDEQLRVTEDRDFWMRLSRVGAFAYIPRVFAKVLRHGENLTDRKYRLRDRYFKVMVLDKALRCHREMKLSAEELHATEDAFRRARDSLLQHAATAGVFTYIRCCKMLASRGHRYVIRPVGVARALMHGMGSGECPWNS